MFVPCIWNSAKFLCCFPNDMVHKTNCHLILKKNNIISFNMDHSLYRDSMWIWRQFTYLYYLFTKTYLAHGGEKRKFCLNVELTVPQSSILKIQFSKLDTQFFTSWKIKIWVSSPDRQLTFDQYCMKQVWESNPGHAGVWRVLSPLCHHCSQYKNIQMFN